MNTEVHESHAIERRSPRAVVGVDGSAASTADDDVELARVPRSAAA